MFRPDVVDLREFYGTPLGLTARRLLRRRIRQVWPALTNLRLLGLGYAVPYLRPFREEVERTLAVMPAPQGVIHWPDEGPSLVTLADDIELPFADGSLDRVLIVHGLETAENARLLLREAWRVLAPTGRLLAVVPNRTGLWARFENTPFGHGHSFTPPQMSNLLREAMFSPVQSGQALYFPPTRRRIMIRAAAWWEDAGLRFWPHFGGVLLVEAEKQVYAPGGGARRAVAVRVRRPALMPGTAAPARLSVDAADRPPGRPAG
jgi:SAM-dependent methyltransferase